MFKEKVEAFFCFACISTNGLHLGSSISACQNEKSVSIAKKQTPNKTSQQILTSTNHMTDSRAANVLKQWPKRQELIC